MLKYHHVIIIYLLFLTSFLLVACSIHTTKYNMSNTLIYHQWHAHQHMLMQIINYQTRGSFFYLSKNHKAYARFHLQQYSTDQYRLLLIHPFGSTALDCRIKRKKMVIINHQDNSYISGNPDIMFQIFTGIAIPISNLRQWILGLPVNATDFSLNSLGYLRTLKYKYHGKYWSVIYLSYYNDTLPPLPEYIKLYHEYDCIKLKLDHWSL